MILALIIVIAAVLSLFLILRIAVSHSLQISKVANGDGDGQIHPIDLAAFRNLASPGEEEFLRRNLRSAQFRAVRRERLRAMAAYVRQSGRNAAVLVSVGQAAMASRDPQIAPAAQQLVNDALLLRRNAVMALLRIYAAMAWPNSGMVAGSIADRYERLNGSAMRLGRLRNPRVPVRLAVTPY